MGRAPRKPYFFPHLLVVWWAGLKPDIKSSLDLGVSGFDTELIREKRCDLVPFCTGPEIDGNRADGLFCFCEADLLGFKEHVFFVDGD